MRLRVIAAGQHAAGDDAVGLKVMEEWHRQGGMDGVEMLAAAEDSDLLSLLETDVPVILVDAVVAQPAGEVWELTPEELADRVHPSVSTHGLGIGGVIALARSLSPDNVSPDIRILAISIDRPDLFSTGLSPAVAAAIPKAICRLRQRAQG